MRAVAILFAFSAVVGCEDPLDGVIHDSIGRPGAAVVEGRILEADDDDDDDDPSVPLDALGDDGSDGVPYTIVVAGRCKRRGVSGPDGLLRAKLTDRCQAPAGRRRVELRALGKRIGSGHVTILPPNRPALVVTSDVDMTYLQTRFHSATEIAALLRAPASRHPALPGMPGLYRRLRAHADALRFVSGSPTFFRRHLEARLKIDGITVDELTLKPIGEIVGARWMKPQTVDKALREQVGYKLAALLEARLRLPRVAREILLGDDTEMDAYAYRLYRDTLAGALAPDRLIARLAELEVDAARRNEIAGLLPRVRAWARPPGGVLLIGIRETDRPNRHHPARAMQDEGVVFHRDTPTLQAALAARHLL